MLKVSVHAGLLKERRAENILAMVDIAYSSKGPLADYLIATTVGQQGERAPQVLAGYPRWSGSLWDLTARAITLSLLGNAPLPPSEKPDKRCAYATKLCAVIEHRTKDEGSTELGNAEIWQQGPTRGTYTVKLDEDILGAREARFEYGCKRLEPLDLVMRALYWALFGQDTPGDRPKLILPTTITVGNEKRFDVASLEEPAYTGFRRYMSATRPNAEPVQWALETDYVQFILEA